MSSPGRTHGAFIRSNESGMRTTAICRPTNNSQNESQIEINSSCAHQQSIIVKVTQSANNELKSTVDRRITCVCVFAARLFSRVDCSDPSPVSNTEHYIIVIGISVVTLNALLNINTNCYNTHKSIDLRLLYCIV